MHQPPRRRARLLASALCLLAVISLCLALLQTNRTGYRGGAAKNPPCTPFDMPPGSSAEETLAALGPPDDRDVRADGSEMWEYRDDPFGFVSYHLKFDTTGRLLIVWS